MAWGRIVQALGGQPLQTASKASYPGLHGVDDLPGCHGCLSNGRLGAAEGDDGDLAVGAGAVIGEA